MWGAIYVVRWTQILAWMLPATVNTYVVTKRPCIHTPQPTMPRVYGTYLATFGRPELTNGAARTTRS